MSSAIQPETNRVVLGHKQELSVPGLLAVPELNWLIDPPGR